MKVLLVCVHFHSSFGWSIERAFSRLGHEVRIFDYRQRPAPWRVGPQKVWERQLMPKQLQEAARSFRPDMLLICKGETIPHEVLQKIRKDLGCLMVNWFPDARLFGYDNVFRSLQHLDYLFSKSAADVSRMKLLGFNNGRVLPHCADRELHVELPSSEEELKPYQCEVAMVGTFYPFREAILQGVAEFDLRVWGPGWKRSSLFRLNPRLIMGRDARSAEQTFVFRASAVNLNTHHFDDVSELNQRVFDIAGSGGCQVTDNYRDLKPTFETPGDIATFRSADELRETVRFLLDHPETRKEMGDRCRRKIAAGHTYDDRVAEILNTIKL